MKKTLITLSVLLSTSVFAQIPEDVKAYMNKSGQYTSTYDGNPTHDSGGDCQVILNPYGELSSIMIEAKGMHNAIAHLDDTTREEEDGVIIYEINESGKRPGGSVCGDTDPLLSYEKLLILDGNSLSIEKSYRCLFGGKTEIVDTCTLN